MAHSRRRRRPIPLVDPDLPITPMLDMSFQLMSFFILTFHPMPTEAQLAMALPKSEGGGQQSVATDIKIEDEELVVQVYAADNGAPVDITAALKTGNVPFGTDTGKLFAFLKERAAQSAAAKEATPRLRLEFADKLNYQFVIKMLDEARRAGFDRISPTLLNPGGKKP